MTQRLERNSGTFLPIALSCLFFVFMAFGAITSLPADAAAPAPEVAEAPLEAPAAEAVNVESIEEEAALPVAMLVEPQPLNHQVSLTQADLSDREIA